MVTMTKSEHKQLFLRRSRFLFSLTFDKIETDFLQCHSLWWLLILVFSKALKDTFTTVRVLSFQILFQPSETLEQISISYKYTELTFESPNIKCLFFHDGFYKVVIIKKKDSNFSISTLTHR